MFQQSLLSSPGARIAGGSDEILRNIIAERVLGLPADIRVDKDGRSTRCRPGGGSPRQSSRRKPSFRVT